MVEVNCIKAIFSAVHLTSAVPEANLSVALQGRARVVRRVSENIAPSNVGFSVDDS